MSFYRLKSALQRLGHWHRRRQLDLVHPASLQPVSRKFGLDRGQPIDRVYIEQFLDAQRQVIRGDCLEIEESTYTARFGAPGHVPYVLKYPGPGDGRSFGQSDERDAQGARIVRCDLAQPDSVPVSRFDALICTQTLSFIFDVRVAVASIHALLRPGGHALITVSGISQISRYDYDRWGDYWRFTDLSLRRLLSACFDESRIQVLTYGNVAAASMFLQGLAVEEVHDPGVFAYQDPDYQIVVCARVQK